MNLNCWIGSGRLTRDAELGQSRKGTSMSKFRIASNGRRDDETLFMNILCFGKMAETLNEFLIKGRLVEIQGKLKVDDFEDAEGNQRTSVCVMADEIALGPPVTPKNEA